ncbi:hypothetical protein [Psychromicrobium xiongbiense]|uniref:hypothetical protein n=1 Tax=Psychromicrobium xiongbiense TaxID=3051184 RepID=UPI0025575555|nr:hypothetical protein [Psychromicrobium sp. YIM S02556]
MARPLTNQALKIATDAAITPQGMPQPFLNGLLERAIESQRPLVRANLRRLQKRPDVSVARVARTLDRDYLSAVSGTGAAIGAVAVIPGLGTVASLGVSAATTLVFLEATALYALSMAELHGAHLDDPDRARAAVMAIMLGEEGAVLMQSLAGRAMTGAGTPMTAWGNALGKSWGRKVPASAVKLVVSQVQRRFIRRFAVEQGGAALGRLLPFGVGAVIGAGANYLMGRSVVKATRLAFGEAPIVLEAPGVPEGLT